MITPMTMGKLPMLLDMHRDECLGELRSRELLAYSHLVSVFRAQGELSKEKRKVLSEVQHLLSISLERHKAEVRRAVNDEVLYTIAEMLFGHNTQVEWAIEARRVVPLLPRAIPQVAYTAYATKMAQEYFNMNMKKPQPRDTAQFNSDKDLGLQSDDTDSEEETTGLRYLSDDALPAALHQQANTRGTPAQANRSAPASSVDDTFNTLSHGAPSSPTPAPLPASSSSSPGKQRKRQRSSSLEALVPQAVPLLLPPHSPISDPCDEGEAGEVQASVTSSLFAGPPPIKQARSGSGGVSMKVSVAGATQRPTPVTSTVSAQKVILVSTSGASGGGSSAVYQRPISVLKSGGSVVGMPPNRLPPAAPPVAVVPVMPVRPMQAVRPMSVGGATAVQTGPPARPVGQGSGGLPGTTMAGWPSAGQPSGYAGQFPVASSILHSAPSTLVAGGGVGMVTRVRPRLTAPLSVPQRGGLPSQRQHRPVAPSQLHRLGAPTQLHYTQQQPQSGQDSTSRVTQPVTRTVGFESGVSYGPMMSSGYSSTAVQQQQHATTLQARVSRTTDMTSAVSGGGMNRVVSVGGAVAGSGVGGGRFITRPASSEGGGGGQPQVTALASAPHQHQQQQQQSLQGSIYHPSHPHHHPQQDPSPQQQQSPPVFVVTTNSSTITVVTRTVAPHNTLQQPGGSASQRVVTLNTGRSSSSTSSLSTTSSTTPLYRSTSLVAGSAGMGVRTALGTITPTSSLKGSGGGEVCSTPRGGGGSGGSISSISFGAFNRTVGGGGLHVTGGVGGGSSVGRSVTSSLRGPTTAAATGVRTSISGGASAATAAGRGVTLSSRGAGVRGAVQAVRGGGLPGGTVQAVRVPAAGAMQALRVPPGGAVQAVRSAAASKSNVIVVHKGTTSATCCSTRDISTKITIGKNVVGDGGPRGVGAAGRGVGATPSLLRTTLQSAPDNRTGITLHASRVALDHHQPKPVQSRIPTPPPPQQHQPRNTATPPPPPPPPQHQPRNTATPPPPPPPPQHQARHTVTLPSTTQHQRQMEYFASSGTGPTDHLCDSSNGSDNSNSSDDSNSSNIVMAVGAGRERRDGHTKEMSSNDLSVKDTAVTAPAAASASPQSSPATSPTPPSTTSTSSTHVTTVSTAAVSTASVPRVSSLRPALSTTTSAIDTPPVDASSCTVATTSETCSSSITLSSSNFTSLQLPAPPVAGFSSVCLSSQSSSSPNFSSSNSFTVGIEGPAPSLELDDDWLSSGVREELSTETTGVTDYTSNNLPDGQMQALEEAMEVLGRGDKEGARTLLLQAGIELLDSPADTSGGMAVGSVSSVTIAAPSHDPHPHVEGVVSHSPPTLGEQEGGGSSSSRVQVVASRSAADYSDPTPAPTLVLTMEAPQSPLPDAGSSSPKDDEDEEEN